MGKYEITFDQWIECTRRGGCTSNPAPSDYGWGRGSRPVIGVSWNDAQEYVRWLSSYTGARYRLPTEAEWEYAARGGTTTPWSWGANPADACGYANFDELFGQYDVPPNFRRRVCAGDSQERPAIVGQYKPNPFGLYDVHGNVFEWVEDCYRAGYAGAPTDGSAVIAADCGHLDRGGSWSSGPSGLASASRPRDPLSADNKWRNRGFRVVRDL
jgi:formylglycine-generating enzyme required for sulfatase activity